MALLALCSKPLSMGSRAGDIAERRQCREAAKRQRELERQAKEQAKLSAIEQARFEVTTYENRLDLLLSLHKEHGQVWDWAGVVASLPPPTPQRHSYHELRARQQACLLSAQQQLQAEPAIAQARIQDDREYQDALRTHAVETEWLEKVKAIAQGILVGDLKAFKRALVELSPLAELSSLGSSIHFTVHSPQLLETVVAVNGIQAIPCEVKSLTATEKLSVKPMPRARFHELYQDYICSCILRVAREVFALLPVNMVLITASVDLSPESSTPSGSRPVLSVAATRASMHIFDFDRLDPHEAIETLQHRDNFKSSRKTSAFAPIVPLAPADIVAQDRVVDRPDLISQVHQMHEGLRNELAQLSRYDLPSEEPRSL